MRGAPPLALALLVASVAACGPSADQEIEPVPGDESPGGETDVNDAAPTPEDPRVLGAGATFGDLVAAARRLDDRREADSDRGCLLAGSAGAPWRLEGDLSVAVRPLPDAPGDLDERVPEAGDRGKVRVLTRWGQLDPAARDLVLVAFTSTPPLRATSAVALLLTDRGVYLRHVGESPIEPFGPLSVDQAGARLQTSLGDAAPPVFVTAETGVDLARLRTLLHWLPESVHGATALAVPLAPETRIPDPGARREDDTGLCPDGLPDPPADAAEGTLSPEQLLGSLTPLREGSRACFDNATGEAATGGRLVVHLRVGPDGEVTEVCFPEDEVKDPGLRSCVAESARATRFPAPDPPGFVDAAIPLSFQPDDSLRQRPLCD